MNEASIMKRVVVILSLILSMSTCVAASGFANTCDNISFSSPSTLRAECLQAGNDQLRTSTINLNGCVGNKNGDLNVRYVTSPLYLLFSTNIFQCRAK